MKGKHYDGQYCFFSLSFVKELPCNLFKTQPNGPALSPDLIFDQIEDSVKRDCGADNIRNATNEMSSRYQLNY